MKGNLFYRRLQLLRPVHIGDTLTTRTEVVALRQNRPKPGRPATGLVALRIQVENQRNKPVLDFWRCPMIPLRDPEGDTGHADSFDDIPADIDLDMLTAKVPWGWRLSAFKDRVGRAGAHFADVVPGPTFVIEGRDTVTNAPELARATLEPGVGPHRPRCRPLRASARLRRPHDLAGRRGRHPGVPQPADDPRLAEL